MAVNYIHFQFPGLARVHCIFQKRSGISSGAPGEGGNLDGNISFLAEDDPERVLAAREELFARLREHGLESWAECRQVHGDRIILNPYPTGLDARPENLPEADGMLCMRPGLGLMIKTADCQPVLLAHKSGQWIMALHVGWRGNRIGFPFSAVERLCAAARLAPQDIFAVRGPSLGPAKSEFVNFEKEWGEEFRPWLNEKNKCVNLWELTRHQLGQAGTPDKNIYEIDICTGLNSGEFFSYRVNRLTGRQASLIWMEKD